MPDLIIAQNLDQELFDRIVAAFVERHGPIPMRPGIPAVFDNSGQVLTPAVLPTPTMTPVQFMRDRLMNYVKNVVRESEREVAVKQVAGAAEQKARNDFAGI